MNLSSLRRNWRERKLNCLFHVKRMENSGRKPNPDIFFVAPGPDTHRLQSKAILKTEERGREEEAGGCD